jgi:hypothetical protein
MADSLYRVTEAKKYLMKSKKMASHCTVDWTGLMGCLVGWLAGSLGLGNE